MVEESSSSSSFVVGSERQEEVVKSEQEESPRTTTAAEADAVADDENDVNVGEQQGDNSNIKDNEIIIEEDVNHNDYLHVVGEPLNDASTDKSSNDPLHLQSAPEEAPSSPSSSQQRQQPQRTSSRSSTGLDSIIEDEEIMFFKDLHHYPNNDDDDDDEEAHFLKKSTTNRKGDDRDKDNDEEEFEGIEIPILNADTFSFLAFVDFCSVSMILLVVVILVQLATVTILLVDIFSSGTPDNPAGVPASVPPTTSIMQILALLITVVSQGDLQDSLNTFFIGYHSLDLELNLGRHAPYWRWVASGVTRFVVASCALATTFLLIVGQSSPRDLLLDFTAIAFVTNLDNITFELASLGYFGLEPQMDASAIILAKTRTLRAIRTDDDDEEDDDEEAAGDGRQHSSSSMRGNILSSSKILNSLRGISNISNTTGNNGNNNSRDSSVASVNDRSENPTTTTTATTMMNGLDTSSGRRNKLVRGSTTFRKSRSRRSKYKLATTESTPRISSRHLSSNRQLSIRDTTTSSSLNTNNINNSVNNNNTAPGDRRRSLTEIGFHMSQKFNIPVAGATKMFKPRQFPRTSILIMMYIAMMIPWCFIFYRQRTGYYLCQTLFVQFGDDFSPEAASFSGIYEIQPGSGGRHQYRGEFNIGEALIGYCASENAWIFAYGENQDDSADVCNWRARSVEIHPLTEESYDVMAVADQKWSVLDNRGWVVPLPYFTMQCYDCENDESFCGGPDQGTCVKNRCVCNNGWNGIRCEFPTFCDHVEVDIRYTPFKGSREWSTSYDLLTSPEADGGDKAVTVYDHPVYLSSAEPFDVMFFNGRRWVIATSEVNDWFQRETIAENLSNGFHGFWSNYTVGFLSVNVDLDSPESGLADPAGLSWFPALSQSGTKEIQAPDFTRPLETILLCTTCSNETNPCSFEGICDVDGDCICTSGSSGNLCQVTPDNNGLCNGFFNTPEFGYDGGDCCEATCTSTPEYSCGTGAIESSGVLAFGFVGFPDCKDPRFSSQISGSKTLFNIVDRGNLRCGATAKKALVELVDGVFVGFEVDLCKAVAAAVLGDPESYEIVITDSKNRFADLSDDKYDLLIRTTTHTAERDIYLGSSNMGYTFASIPYFYDGLRYAGIPQYADCADRLDFVSAECLDLKICIAEPTSWYSVTREYFPDSVLVVLNAVDDGITFLDEGLCNVIAGETFDVIESQVRKKGYTGDEYAIGSNLFSKEPLAAVTRQDDRVWSKFVSWIFDALVQAEEFGITKTTAGSLAPSDFFGAEFRNMFRDAVEANGNYGELYDRHLEAFLPRGGLNQVNNGTTGLIYSFPFGNFDSFGPEPSPGSTIASIRNRGFLTCGIKPQPGFSSFDATSSTWSGIDVDLCRGIAAAIFNGDPQVQFAPFQSRQRFPALSRGAVDVLAAVTTHTLEREVNEPFTGQFFDFSPSYFHAGIGFAGPTPFGQCADELKFDGDCSATKICTVEGTTTLDSIVGPLQVPETNLLVVDSHRTMYEKLVSGECNAISGESTTISQSTVVENGYALTVGNTTVEFFVGNPSHSKEPISLVTRSDDAQFSDFVRWILLGYFYAEERGINQGSSFRMPITHLFGETLVNTWTHSVEASGNFGEMFERNFDGLVRRTGKNLLNEIGGPQLIAKPGVVQ